MADRKDLVRRFYTEVFEKRNLDALDELVADDVVEHEMPPPGVEMKPGREGVKQALAAYLSAFDGFAIDVQAQYQDGDTVISRAVFTAKHVGTFAGVPPTGKTASVEAIDIIRYSGDRVVEHWGQMDVVGLLAQLGALPPMG